MLNAAMMGAVAFQKGLGVTHSLAHALSTVCDLHHGLVNGVAIPYAMAFNAETSRATFFSSRPVSPVAPVATPRLVMCCSVVAAHVPPRRRSARRRKQ